jgi:glycosyltransferase involved in cell wall biosynthesis
MPQRSPQITICIPHYQVLDYITCCLRSIRKHSANYDLEVIVVDNGSHDASLDYLRGLDWIRLIERPEEVHTNWPLNVFTAWDLGFAQSRSPYYITMHSDVFVKRDGWLDPLLREIERGDKIAASGAWKLDLENPLYALQKRVVGYAAGRIKQFAGRKSGVKWKQGHYPRDYCAMYRREPIARHGLTFRPVHGQGGGYSIAKQLWDAGYEMGIVPVSEMYRNVFHVAHGTAAVIPEKRLNHARAQKKVETKVAELFREKWIRALQLDESLDGVKAAA